MPLVFSVPLYVSLSSFLRYSKRLPRFFPAILCRCLSLIYEDTRTNLRSYWYLRLSRALFLRPVASPLLLCYLWPSFFVVVPPSVSFRFISSFLFFSLQISIILYEHYILTIVISSLSLMSLLFFFFLLSLKCGLSFFFFSFVSRCPIMLFFYLFFFDSHFFLLYENTRKAKCRGMEDSTRCSNLRR